VLSGENPSPHRTAIMVKFHFQEGRAHA
jgi:hypothetical protein